MKNLLKAPPDRIFGCATACAKLTLTLVLFAPPLATLSWRAGEPAENTSSAVIEARAFSRPRELMQIFSIVRSHRLDVAEAEIWRLAEVIHEESSKRQLDPLLILALIRIESGFQPSAVSPAGARGIMQIMPDTGKTLAGAMGGEYGFHPARFTAESLDDPVINLRLGIYYLHDLKKRFHHWSVALTAYNYGPADTQSRIDNNLDLSEDFAATVMDNYKRYKSANAPAF